MSSPSPTSAVAAVGGDDDAPSTSLVRFGGTIRARLALLVNRTKSNWMRNFEEIQERVLPENFSFRSAVAVPVFGDVRLTKWAEGIDRVKDIYRLDMTMEWKIVKIAFWTSFILCVGYLFGGATTLAESVRRFEVYTAGKIYMDRPHNQLRSRRLNYTLFRFNARGCKVGLKLAFGALSMTALVLVPTTFFHHFSLLNLPLATMMVLGASSTLRDWGKLGWFACVPPTIFINTVPLLVILCYCLYYHCTPNECYWRVKAGYEQEMRVDADYSRELDAYARFRQKSQTFRHFPWARIQMERERKLNTWKWTSGVEDGLVHLDETTPAAAVGEGDNAQDSAAGDELGEEEQQLLKALEEKRRGPWWRRLLA